MDLDEIINDMETIDLDEIERRLREQGRWVDNDTDPAPGPLPDEAA